MAAVTTNLRFSNAVFIAPARPLLEVAKQVATASVLSAGRVSLAVGAGWMRGSSSSSARTSTTVAPGSTR